MVLARKLDRGPDGQAVRICVVGSGFRFLSGISYYTVRLANALVRRHEVSVILMRRLLPAHFYPGRARVGKRLTNVQLEPSVRAFDGVDWYWLPSIFRALAFLIRERPQLVALQWWSGTTLHSYLVLAITARLIGAHVVIEFHEVLDTAEMSLLAARAYVRAVAPFLVALAHAFVVHSDFDKAVLGKRYAFGERPVLVIHHGPYDQYRSETHEPINARPPDSCCNLLFFGVIRPFKGLEDLIRAFDAIPEDEIGGYWLTVVGETWENWTLPVDLIAASRYRERITLVNRYVTDAEVANFFAGADAVALPYHRSSASGPLHVAMSYGLPLVVTSVGGLPEAVAGYKGAILVQPRDPLGLRDALRRVAAWRGERFGDVHSWDRTVERYEALSEVLAPRRARVQESIG